MRAPCSFFAVCLLSKVRRRRTGYKAHFLVVPNDGFVSKIARIHSVSDIWTTFVPAKIVHISEKSIYQKAI